MPKTSDFCLRCQSVQVGLRRGDGQFVCLRCSTKQEVAEAAAVPIRVGGSDDLRSSKRLGMASLCFGVLVALAAVPVTLYCRASGDPSTAFLVILPAAMFPLFMGLIAGRSRMGQGGALLGLAGSIIVLFMVLVLESKKSHPQPLPQSLPQSLPQPLPQPLQQPLQQNRVTNRNVTPTPAPRYHSRLRVPLPDAPVSASDPTLLAPDGASGKTGQSETLHNDGTVESLDALRARAEKEQRHLDGLRRLQELFNVYYAAAQQAEQLAGQRELLNIQRARTKGQIDACELRVRAARSEDAKSAQTPGDGGREAVTFHDAYPGNSNLYTQAERIAFERKELETQLADLDNQVFVLTRQIGEARAKATVVAKTIRDHCALIGEPVPELRTFMDLPDTPGTAGDRNEAVAKEGVPAKRVAKLYRLRTGVVIRVVEAQRRGEALVLEGQDGQTHTVLESEVQEILAQPDMSNGEKLSGPNPVSPVETPPAPEPESSPPAESGKDSPSAAEGAQLKTYVLRDGRRIKARHVIEMGGELAIRDEEGEVYRVKQEDVLKIIP